MLIEDVSIYDGCTDNRGRLTVRGTIRASRSGDPEVRRAAVPAAPPPPPPLARVRDPRPCLLGLR